PWLPCRIAFQAWANGPAIAAHAGHRANPVATRASS
ncbi:hypothetical protein ACNJQJ_21785, partial [Mycobacterium tuberculosis]